MTESQRAVLDVIVVGAGPGGLSAARALASEGRSVLVLEEHDTVGQPVHCTGLLGIEAFDELDLPRETIRTVLRSARFRGADGRSVAVDAQGVAAAVVDRGAFDRALARQAQTAGAELRCGYRVQSISIDAHAVSIGATTSEGETVTFRGRACVLACGAQYRFNRQLGLGIPRAYLQTAQIETGFAPLDAVEIDLDRSIAPGGFAWVVPFAIDGVPAARVGLMASSSAAVRFTKYAHALAGRFALPASAAALASPRLKLLPLGPVRRTYGDRVLAVGDAAGLAKPTTGGGIYYSLLSGQIAARVLAERLRDDRLRRRRAPSLRDPMARAARARAARGFGVSHAGSPLRQPRRRCPARARRGGRHRPSAAPHGRLQLAPPDRAGPAAQSRFSTDYPQQFVDLNRRLLARMIASGRVDTALDDDQRELARADGVLPLIDRMRGGLAAVRGHAALQLARQARLTRVLDLLAADGVTAIVFKGAHLAYACYPDPALRPYVDVDLLIRPTDVDAARRVFERAGHRLIPHVSGRFVMSQFHYVDGAVGGPHAYDVHWQIANPVPFRNALPFDELHASAVPLTVFGRNGLGPSLPHALLLACAHRAAHHGGGDRLIWLMDLRLMLQMATREQIDRFCACADQAGLNAVCYDACARAAELFGDVAVPEPLRSRAAKSLERTRAYLKSPTPLTQVWLDLQALPTWRDRTSLVREHLFPPASYMKASTTPRTPLVWAYTARLVRGAWSFRSGGVEKSRSGEVKK